MSLSLLTNYVDVKFTALTYAAHNPIIVKLHRGTSSPKRWKLNTLLLAEKILN